jgi:hypothetical protein
MPYAGRRCDEVKDKAHAGTRFGWPAAAVHRPFGGDRLELILLMNPVRPLDPISTAKIEELISEFCEDHTITIVTHNMQQASADYTASCSGRTHRVRRDGENHDPANKRPTTHGPLRPSDGVGGATLAFDEARDSATMNGDIRND